VALPDNGLAGPMADKSLRVTDASHPASRQIVRGDQNRKLAMLSYCTEDPFGGSIRNHLDVITHYRFYEKVIKVKADVAALVDSLRRVIIFVPGPTSGRLDSAEAKPVDRARGGSAERLETPLAGGAAALAVPAVLAGAERAAAWGEPPRPGFPLGETGKGDQIPCCRRPFCLASDVAFLRFPVYISPRVW